MIFGLVTGLRGQGVMYSTVTLALSVLDVTIAEVETLAVFKVSHLHDPHVCCFLYPKDIDKGVE
jgi:hypothetical protein